MQFFRALNAFYQTLFNGPCEHHRVSPQSAQHGNACFCPDCGYKIQVLWTLCRCRTCGSKRHTKIGADGRAGSLYKYCQHCGQTDYQIIKKSKINVHEIPYAILTKEIDYSEERLVKPNLKTNVKANPFTACKGFDVVDGEVLRSEQVYFGGKQAKIFF